MLVVCFAGVAAAFTLAAVIAHPAPALPPLCLECGRVNQLKVIKERLREWRLRHLRPVARWQAWSPLADARIC